MKQDAGKGTPETENDSVWKPRCCLQRRANRTKNEQGKAEGNEIRVARSCGNILENIEKSLDFLLSTRESFAITLSKEVTKRRSLAQIDFCFIAGGQT